MDLIKAGHQHEIVGLGIIATGIVKIAAFDRQLINDEFNKLLLGSWKRGFK